MQNIDLKNPDLEKLKEDCQNGLKQIENINDIRLEIKRGMEYNIDKFNNIFNSTEYPIAILNINLGNIFVLYLI